MNPTQLSPRQHLQLALGHYQIPILKSDETKFYLEKDYEIELEKGFLFKLWWQGEVVAPFSDLDELCQFLKMA